MKRSHLVCYGAALLLIGAFALREGVNIHVDQEKINVIYGEKAPELPAFSADLYGHPVNQMVAVNDRINYTRVGEYTVDYTFRVLGIPLRTVRIPASVLDMEAPVIDLKEGTICFTKTNAPWSFPDYSVHDNYELVHDIRVSITGGADNHTPGTYEAKLKACDSSGNCSMKSLTVITGDAGEEDFLPENFDLAKLDTHGVLWSPQEDYDESLFQELYWLGDSNVLNLGFYDGLPPYRVMAQYALSPASFETALYYNNRLRYRNAERLVRELGVKRLFIMMGEAEAGSGDPVKLAEDYGACIDRLLEVNPDLKIIVGAILPIVEGSSKASASQEEINRANYCLLQMCCEKKIPMITAESWLKDESGYGKPEYYLEDGYHLKGAHYSILTSYVRESLRP